MSNELIIEWEDGESKPLDPLADLKLYFAGAELQRQQRIIEQRENQQGLSIYEIARQR